MRNLLLSSILLASFGLTNIASAQTLCNDGTISSSSGRGTCSHHGGIAKLGKQTIDFDAVDITGKIKKPSVKIINEPNHRKFCSHVQINSPEYQECMLNLSFDDIKSVCDSIRHNNLQIQPILDQIVQIKDKKKIDEPNGWSYKKINGVYQVTHAPRRYKKYIGRKLTDKKELKAIRQAQIEEDKLAIGYLKDKKFNETLWQTCISNGTKGAINSDAIAIRKENDTQVVFRNVPILYSNCYGRLEERLGINGIKQVCTSGFDYQNAEYNTRNNWIDVLNIDDSSSSGYNGIQGNTYHIISPWLIIVETPKFKGIMYRTSADLSDKNKIKWNKLMIDVAYDRKGMREAYKREYIKIKSKEQQKKKSTYSKSYSNPRYTKKYERDNGRFLKSAGWGLLASVPFFIKAASYSGKPSDTLIVTDQLGKKTPTEMQIFYTNTGLIAMGLVTTSVFVISGEF